MNKEKLIWNLDGLPRRKNNTPFWLSVVQFGWSTLRWNNKSPSVPVIGFVETRQMSRYEKASWTKGWIFSPGFEHVNLLLTITQHKMPVRNTSEAKEIRRSRDSKSNEKSKCIAFTNCKNRVGLLIPFCNVEGILSRVAHMRTFDLEFKKVWQTISISCVKFKMASTSGDYAVNTF